MNTRGIKSKELNGCTVTIFTDDLARLVSGFEFLMGFALNQILREKCIYLIYKQGEWWTLLSAITARSKVSDTSSRIIRKQCLVKVQKDLTYERS